MRGMACKHSHVLKLRRDGAVWKMAVHLAVAGDVFNGVLFCTVVFPTRCLG